MRRVVYVLGDVAARREPVYAIADLRPSSTA